MLLVLLSGGMTNTTSAANDTIIYITTIITTVSTTNTTNITNTTTWKTQFTDIKEKLFNCW